MPRHRLTASCRLPWTAVALVASLLVGCVSVRTFPAAASSAGELERRADASVTPPPSPIGVNWLFVWVKGFAGDPASLLPLPGFILTPEARMLRGNASCNRFHAGYVYDAESGRLAFTNLVNTRMMCQRANAEAENAILAALLATDACRLADGRLELLSRGEAVARLVAK
jgi:heat shock protein HslJ